MARIKKKIDAEITVFPGLKEPTDFVRIRSGKKRMGQFCCRFVAEIYDAIGIYSKQKHQSRAEIVRIAVVNLLQQEGLL